MPAISTSSPGSKPCSSRARMTPIPRRPSSTHPQPPAPACRRRLGVRGGYEIGLRQGEYARQPREPRIVVGELGLDRRVVELRIGAVQGRKVEHVHEQARALDVSEEVVAEPGARGGALDQAWDGGDDELTPVALERAEHRL